MTAKTLLKGLRVLEAFDIGSRELTLSDIVQATGLEISGARRFLTTLRGAGYLTQDRQTRRYRLSAKVLSFAVSYLGADPLVACSHPILQSVANETGFQLELSVLQEAECVVLVSFAGEGTKKSHVAGPSIGVREPAHCAAPSLAVLSHLPAKTVHDLLASWPLDRITNRTVVEVEQIMEQLAAYRRLGYAISNRELFARAISIGAPILDFAQQPIAAVAGTVDVDDYTLAAAKRDLAPIVVKAAQAISNAYQRAT